MISITAGVCGTGRRPEKILVKLTHTEMGRSHSGLFLLSVMVLGVLLIRRRVVMVVVMFVVAARKPEGVRVFFFKESIFQSTFQVTYFKSLECHPMVELQQRLGNLLAVIGTNERCISIIHRNNYNPYLIYMALERIFYVMKIQTTLQLLPKP